MLELTKYHNSLLKAVGKASYEAMAVPVAFVIVFAEPGDSKDQTVFHFRASTICFTDAMIEGMNQAVARCFKAVPADDYKVYHA